jgi:hypothetical protein
MSAPAPKKQSKSMSEILQDHYFPGMKKREELELRQEALALESAVEEHHLLQAQLAFEKDIKRTQAKVALKKARIAELQESHDRLQAELCSNTHPWEEQMNIIKQMNALTNEIMCEEYPELKGQTCPICDKKFNGWGNNPAPLDTNKVCDSCNIDIIVPIRMGNKRLEKAVNKKLTSQ